jgi:hypothetical protein
MSPAMSPAPMAAQTASAEPPAGPAAGTRATHIVEPGPRLPEIGRAIGRAFAVAGFGLSLWLLSWLFSHLALAGMRTMSHRLLGAIGIGLGVVIGGAAWGNQQALFLALLLGVPFELPVSWALRSEPSLLRRKARWLVRFLAEKPRGHNTPGGHLACGVIAIKKLLKRAALRRERRSPGLRALERRRSRLVRQHRRASDLAFRSLCRADARAAAHGRRASAFTEELTQVDAALLHERLDIQSAVVDAFLLAFEQAWRGAQAPEPDADATFRGAVAQLGQPDDEPRALLPNGLVRSPLALAFDYGMFLGRVLMALLFVSTSEPPFLVIGLLLFVLELYVVEPVVFKLHVGALNLLHEVRGHKLADCRKAIDAMTVGSEVFRLPIVVPKFSTNPAWAQLSAIIDAAIRRSGTRPVRITPFAMRADNRRTVLELGEGPTEEMEERAARLVTALRTELAANRARFPLDVEVHQDAHQDGHQDGHRVSLTLLGDEQRIWNLLGEDASQAFVYLWKNLRALRDSLGHLGPRFQPVFILASNTKDPDVIQYEIDHLTELQWWSNTHHHGQVGFLYLLRGGAWYSYNPRLCGFDADDKDFLAALGGIEERLADPANPLREPVLSALGISGAPALTGSPNDPEVVERRQGLARVLDRLLADPGLHRRFDGFDFDALPPHRQPTASTRALLERRRAEHPLSSAELTALNRELIFTALPMRGSGGFFKKVGNDIAVHELLVAGKTRPTVYTDRRTHEHVQDGGLPNYGLVWGDFARYTGLVGSNEQIHSAILAGRDLTVGSIPELAAILDDKNCFGPGELEKGLGAMLHPENRHIVIGVPRIEVTLPEEQGRPISSPFARGVQVAREIHNAADGLTKAGIFDLSSAAYGKWFLRPKAYFSHYALEVLNAAHALSHDFQQSYLVAGAAGRLGAFSEALYGPSRFEITSEERQARRAEERVEIGKASAPRGWGREPSLQPAAGPGRVGAARAGAMDLKDIQVRGAE